LQWRCFSFLPVSGMGLSTRKATPPFLYFHTLWLYLFASSNPDSVLRREDQERYRGIGHQMEVSVRHGLSCHHADVYSDVVAIGRMIGLSRLSNDLDQHPNRGLFKLARMLLASEPPALEETRFAAE
jgi:hypothetical protein